MSNEQYPDEMHQNLIEKPESDLTHPKPPLIIDKDPKEVPIRREQYEEFKGWFCQNETDKELLDKIIRNIRFVDETDFDEAVRQMEDAIAAFTDGDPYYLIVDEPGKSGDLMLDKLNLSSNPPARIIRRTEITEGRQKDQKVQARRAVVVDDAAYSGDSFVNKAHNIEKILQVAPEDTMIACTAMTSKAARRLAETYGKVFYKYHVPMASEIFSPDELSYLKEKYWQSGDINRFTHLETRVLTFLYSKVPDNFLTGLRRGQAVLIDEGGEYDEPYYIIDDITPGVDVYPPYRKH